MRTTPDRTYGAPPSLSVRSSDCEAVVRQASELIDGVLSGTERRAVEEHLGTCDACSSHLGQLHTTMKLLARRPGVVPEGLRQAVEAAVSDVDMRFARAAKDAVCEHGPRLLALARTLDEEAAEDLVQATWERALVEGPDAFTFQRLVELLLGEADHDEVKVSVGDAARPGGESQAHEFDPDADTGEVFYPHFYNDGPDVGRWVQPPRSWDETGILSPEDDLTTAELYEVVDAALGEVGGDGGRLLALVDMGGLDSGDAADFLGLEQSAARRSLHAARNHVRAALDDYLTGRASGASTQP